MSLQLSIAIRNAQSNAIEIVIGTTPVLRIYELSGSPPADCNTVISGTILATIIMPSNWLYDPYNGSKNILGTWECLSAEANGSANYFRIFTSDGLNCHIQGTVTITGDGGDMTLDDVTINIGQAITISTFTLTAGNA